VQVVYTHVPLDTKQYCLVAVTRQWCPVKNDTHIYGPYIWVYRTLFDTCVYCPYIRVTGTHWYTLPVYMGCIYGSYIWVVCIGLEQLDSSAMDIAHETCEVSAMRGSYTLFPNSFGEDLFCICWHFWLIHVCVLDYCTTLCDGPVIACMPICPFFCPSQIGILSKCGQHPRGP